MTFGERLPLAWMPWPLSIRIFMGLWSDSSSIPSVIPGRAGDDGAKVMKCCRERNNRE